MTNYARGADWEPMQDYGPDGQDAASDAYEAALNLGRDVAAELRKLRIRKAAQELFKAENEPVAPPFDAGTLGEILARPPDPPMRVDGLIPWDSSALVVAQRKTGKTTFDLNLTRCLLTGEDFLGRFAVRPIDGIVGILNFEVSAAMLGRWADEHGIDRERFYMVNLRGRRNPFTHPGDRETLAADLRGRGVETLICDPFGRAYPGKSQNDPGEVGAWLVDLDVFARGEVGAKDVILSAHAGWNGERTRGSSALEDWADVILTMTRDPDDDSLRFLKAEGRDVDLAEDQLAFDPDTRTLSLAGTGSRKMSRDGRRLDELVTAVMEQVTAAPGINGTELGVALKDAGVSFQKGDERKAARAGVDAGYLSVEAGPRNSKRYFLTELPRHTPTYPGGVPLTYPDPTLIGGVGQGGTEEAELPRTSQASTEALRNCLCGSPISDQRHWAGKDQCVDCEAAS
jgi:AAA domain